MSSERFNPNLKSKENRYCPTGVCSLERKLNTIKPLQKTLNIGGHVITVQFDENLLSDREHYGEWCYRDLSIIINGTSNQTVRQQTLLHEIVEAINELNELGLEHDKIQTLSTALFQVLKHNEDLFGKV